MRDGQSIEEGQNLDGFKEGETDNDSGDGNHEATFGTSMAGMPAAQAQDVADRGYSSCRVPQETALCIRVGHHFHPRYWQIRFCVESDQAVVLSISRLVRRDPEAITTTNEFCAMSREQQERVESTLGLVGRRSQNAKPVGREMCEDWVLKNTGRRTRGDIHIVGWQSHAMQYEEGRSLM